MPDREQYKHVTKSLFSNKVLKNSQGIVGVIENDGHNFDREHSFLYSSSNDTESEPDNMDDELVDAGK